MSEIPIWQTDLRCLMKNDDDKGINLCAFILLGG